LREPILAT
jgi:hypothetical protein